ncbi:response regulator [Candidatus Woesearchaeota archaeon]|nr:response regulator [Candidatus Woesearchaeota archaeon]
MTHKILCVDDNENMLKLYSLLLSDIGDVDCAPTIEVALHKIRGQEYDLVITDYTFGRIARGLDLLEALQGREQPYRLMFSSDPSPEELNRTVQELGGLGCVEKLQCNNLAHIVREVLAQGKDSPLLQMYLRERYSGSNGDSKK